MAAIDRSRRFQMLKVAREEVPVAMAEAEYCGIDAP